MEDRPRDVRRLEALLEAGRLLGKHAARVLFLVFSFAVLDYFNWDERL